MKTKFLLLPLAIGALTAPFVLSGETMALTASQDTFVRSEQNVQGFTDTLLVGGHSSVGPFNSFYKFQLDALELAGATINSVTLRLTSIATAGAGTVNINLYEVSTANADWFEGTGPDSNSSAGSTFNWKDYASGTTIAQVPWASGNTNANFVAGTDYVSTVLGNYTGPTNSATGGEVFDLPGNASLTALVEAALGGELNLIVMDQTGNGTNFLRIASKENTSYAGPQLIIDYTPGGGSTLTLDAIEDTFVRSDSPNNAYGTDAQLLVGDHATIGPFNSFYKFNLDVPELAGATINSVILQLTSDAQAGSGTVDLKLYELSAGNADWIEGVSGAVGVGPYTESTGCTFNNKAGEGFYATPWAGGNDNAGFLPGIDFVNTELGAYSGSANTATGGEIFTFGFGDSDFVSAAQGSIGGELNLIIMGQTGNNSNFLRIASKEHATLDGPKLLISYSTGTPSVPVPIIVGEIVGGSFEVTVPGSVSGYSYKLQTSSDMTPGSWTAGSSQNGDGSDLLFTVTAPASGAKVFCRVDVTAL
jgi:uncharacterized protein YaiE (UPF0345 family)